MKKIIIIFLFSTLILSCEKLGFSTGRSMANNNNNTVEFAEVIRDHSNVQKFALVIGNGNYTGISKLKNPVNDANDITAALQKLGFSVVKVLNGSLDQMEYAIETFKDRLSKTSDSYGFLFYAGHGVQSNGENYLIPVDANIQNESNLRVRAVSVQAVLDELNNAGNILNIIVLDACRDNPFGWSRSGSRGLTVLSNPPADSIIVYATSAGSVAADGDGRNGLFTSQLLPNLASPGLEINEIFRRTMSGVLQESNNQQRPAIYNQFPGIAYLGEAPSEDSAFIETGAITVSAGALEINTVTGGTLEIRGSSGSRRINIPDYGTLPVNQIGAGDYTLVMRYSDGKTEEKNVKVSANEKSAVSFSYQIAEAATTGNTTQAKTHYDIGMAHFNKEDYAAAINEFTEAIKLNPKNDLAYGMRARSYNMNKEFNKADDDINQALKINPKNVFAYHAQGYKKAYMNDFDGAIAAYTQLLKIDPNYAVAYRNRGNAYLRKNDNDKAIVDFNQAIKLDPNNAGAYSNRGIVYYNKNDFDKAIADYTQAIRINPNLAEAYHNRGNVYKKLGDTVKANADFNKAKELDKAK